MKVSLTFHDLDMGTAMTLLNVANGGGSTVLMSPSINAPTGDDGDDNAPANPNAPQTDANGLPWDERIHSGSKALTEKNVWRKRKGVSDTTVAAVEAELRQRVQHPPQPQQTQSYTLPPQQPMQQPPMMPQQQPAPAPMQQPPMMPQQQYQQPMQQPPMMPQQQPAPAPEQPQQPQAMDFPTFMQGLQVAMQKRDAAGNPLVDANYLVTVVQRLNAAYGANLDAITRLGEFPHMIGYAVQLMQSEGRW